jgi:hypothetical protein
MSNKSILILLVILVVVLGFVLTCPNKDMHKKAAVAQISQIIQSDSSAQADMNAIGGAVVTSALSTAMDNILTVNNYAVFSLGTVKYNNDNRVVSIGVLHHVFILLNKEDLAGIDSEAMTPEDQGNE